MTDPSAPQIHEGTGAVAKDSLAAESTEFQKANRNSEPLGVKGANSTFANTNTSGAVKLDAAKDAEARQEKYSSEERSGAREQKQGFESGRPKEQESERRGESAGVAPSYVNSQAVDHGGPKGKNLKEDDNCTYTRTVVVREIELTLDTTVTGKNASFNNEIGTKNDPGRLAEEKFAQDNADAAGTLAGFPKQAGSADENPFGTLKGSSQ